MTKIQFSPEALALSDTIDTWKIELQNARAQIKREQEISKTYADRSYAALKYLHGMIDGDSPWDSEISNVIRILEGS